MSTLRTVDAKLGHRERLTNGAEYYSSNKINMQNNKSDMFVIMRVCREDLENIGYDTSDIEDDTMTELASKLGESLMNEFWIDLPIIADHLEISKKPE